MKIAYLTHTTDSSNGWGRFSHQLHSEIQKKGHEIIVITERGGEYPFIRRGVGILWSALRILPLLRSVDVVHAMDVYPFGVIAWIATRFLQKPLLVSAQGTYSIAPLEHSKYRFLYRIIARRFDRVVAISAYTADRFRRAIGGGGRLRIIHHGVDLQRWSPMPDAHRELAVISVGSVKYRKGYHVALQAFAEAKKRLPELQWWIVGDTRDRGYVESLKRATEAMGLTNSVVWYERISDGDLQNLYSRASLFMLLSVNQGSHFEGFGLVFLEAAACGLPVLGTTGNGILDAVSKDNGVLVDQEDDAAASCAIVNILSNDDILLRMSSASLKWAQAHRLDRVAAQYLEEYLSIRR